MTAAVSGVICSIAARKRTGLAAAAWLLLWCAALTGQEPQPALMIGAADGPVGEVFGQIHDVLADTAGNIFVLDNQALEVRWFDGTGVLRGRGGGSGSGPGQLRGPQRLALLGTGDLLVLDPLNGRISRFRTSSNGLSHVADIRSPPAFDFCAIGRTLFLLRLRPDSVVTVLDAEGTVIGAWGSLVEPLVGHELPPEDIRRELDNRARMLCDVETMTITLLHDRIPLVRRFSTTGEPIWEIELADYHRVRDVATPDESGWMAAPDPETGTAHTGRSITTGDEDTLVVTLYEGSAEGGRYEVRVLSGSTGEELRRAPVPMIVTSVGPDAVTGYVNRPIPRVLRFDGRPFTKE